MLIFMIVFAIIIYVVLGSALLIFLRNYSKLFLSMFSFRGYMARKDFWKTLGIFLLTLPFVVYIVVMITEYIPSLNQNLTMAVTMWLMLPWTAAICRRLNDVGVPGIIRYILTIPLFIISILSTFFCTFLIFSSGFSEDILLLSYKIYQSIYKIFVILIIAAPFLIVISLVLALFPSRKRQ